MHIEEEEKMILSNDALKAAAAAALRWNIDKCGASVCKTHWYSNANSMHRTLTTIIDNRGKEDGEYG